MVNEKYIKCSDCICYKTCKEIETKFGKQLESNGGNWRAIFENGIRVGTPIRRCARTIAEFHLEKFKNVNMLEIGCGPMSEINLSSCKKYNIKYEGIDPDRTRTVFIESKNNKLESIQNKLLFKLFKILGIKKYSLNNHQSFYIDKYPSRMLEKMKYRLIYGNSTIEHWHQDEKNVDVATNKYIIDISKCHENLEENGVLMLNCPIYVHGNKLFMEGMLENIKRIFIESANWKNITFEYWRKNHSDLLPYAPEKRKKYFKEAFNIDLENMWLMNVIAEK